MTSTISVDRLPHVEFDEDGKPSATLLRRVAKEATVVFDELWEAAALAQKQGGNFIYIGLGGLALAFLTAGDVVMKIGGKRNPLNRTAIEFYECASLLLERSMVSIMPEKPKKKTYTFLESSFGLLALQVAVMSRQVTTGARPEADAFGIYEKVSEMLKIAEEAANLLPMGDCELLYGRCGVLYGLYYVSEQPLVDKTRLIPLMKTLAGQIVESGILLAQDVNASDESTFNETGAAIGLPLLYRWHDKEYMGACHGYVGILQVLTLVKNALGDDDDDFSHHTTVPAFHEAIGHLAENIFTEGLLPSGNLPSSLPVFKAKDRLVQWCHGAPGGLVTLRRLLESPNLNLRSKHIFQTAIDKMSSLVRERGCVPKLGICHGLGGNGMALLKAARISQNPKVIRRAAQYAIFGFENRTTFMKNADRPYSLFEGLAGLAILQLAVIADDFYEVSFPGYDISNLE